MQILIAVSLSPIRRTFQYKKAKSVDKWSSYRCIAVAIYCMRLSVYTKLNWTWHRRA